MKKAHATYVYVTNNLQNSYFANLISLKFSSKPYTMNLCQNRTAEATLKFRKSIGSFASTGVEREEIRGCDSENTPSSALKKQLIFLNDKADET